MEFIFSVLSPCTSCINTKLWNPSQTERLLFLSHWVLINAINTVACCWVGKIEFLIVWVIA